MDVMLQPVMQFVRRGELCWLPFEDVPLNPVVKSLNYLPRKDLAKEWWRRYDRAYRDPELHFSVFTRDGVNTWLARAGRPPLAATHPEGNHLIVVNFALWRDIVERQAEGEQPQVD
jgi:hypothetical protein